MNIYGGINPREYLLKVPSRNNENSNRHSICSKNVCKFLVSGSNGYEQ